MYQGFSPVCQEVFYTTVQKELMCTGVRGTVERGKSNSQVLQAGKYISSEKKHVLPLWTCPKSD